MAAGLDAGNRSMAQAGRKAWNKADWQAACDVTAPLFRLLEALQDGQRKVAP